MTHVTPLNPKQHVLSLSRAESRTHLQPFHDRGLIQKDVREKDEQRLFLLPQQILHLRVGLEAGAGLGRPEVVDVAQMLTRELGGFAGRKSHRRHVE